MKIKVNILPSELRTRYKIRSYALRIATLSEDYHLRNKTLIIYPSKYQTGTESTDPRFFK